MSKTVFVLNGPNLNMLGKREPGIYGAATLKDVENDCIAAGKELGFTVDFRQSNHEGVLIDWMHEANEKAVGVAINAGAYPYLDRIARRHQGDLRAGDRASYFECPRAGGIPPSFDDRTGGKGRDLRFWHRKLHSGVARLEIHYRLTR